MTLGAWVKRVVGGLKHAFSTSSGDGAAQKQPDETVAGEKAPDGTVRAAAPAASVYASSLNQWSTAVTWLIGALAAIAAAIIAGSQLSSIGQLSYDTQRGRLLLAAGAVVVAVGLVLLAIGLLFWAQSPSNTDFSRLKELAAGDRAFGLAAQVRRQVCDDSSLHRGQGDLGGLLTAVAETRTDYYKLRIDQYTKARQVAREIDDAKRNAADEVRKRTADELAVVDAQLTEYRLGLLRVAQLDAFLRTRRRYRIASLAVLFISVLVTLAFVTFAWAANPPADREEAAAQRPVAATLNLTTEGQQALQLRLGSTCAAAAASSAGVPVVALSSSDEGVEVVAVPSPDCPAPQRVMITVDNGTVTADRSVLTGS